MSLNTKQLFVVTGPTAVGKTDLTVELAKVFNTEIISCDSRQFYKEMSIGTAKPTPEEMQGIPHHFIDSHTIVQELTAGQFEKDCLQLIEEKFEKHNALILTGGSGLFLNAVLFGIDELPSIQPTIRLQLEELFEKEGIEGLQQQLQQLDPDYYQQVDLANHRRLIRALEVCLSTGTSYSSQRKKTVKKRSFAVKGVVLNRDREELYERINQRVNLMLEVGLEPEAKNLSHFKQKTALKTVGYQEFFEYFDGNISKEEAIELIKRNSRRYAKRQLTWFRKLDGFKWFHPSEKEAILAFLKNT